MPKFVDKTNQRHGRLLVVERANNNEYGKVCWLCKCDCGEFTTVASGHLTTGHTQSCGCFHEETLKSNVKTSNMRRNNPKEGRTRLYKIYHGMRARTENKNNCNYKNYGERGIEVCGEWLGSFASFKKWAINNGYRDDLSIDRIDVNGNYEPSNCRWADQETQGNNTRVNRNITFNGKTQTTAQWAKEIGIKADTLRKRLNFGQSVEKALALI